MFHSGAVVAFFIDAHHMQAAKLLHGHFHGRFHHFNPALGKLSVALLIKARDDVGIKI
jgi:hypothetical protein